MLALLFNGSLVGGGVPVGGEDECGVFGRTGEFEGVVVGGVDDGEGFFVDYSGALEDVGAFEAEEDCVFGVGFGGEVGVVRLGLGGVVCGALFELLGGGCRHGHCLS